SAAPEGTVLKGLNYIKDRADPIALEDKAYPEWLWSLLDEKKQKQKTSKPANRQFHRKQNRESIKASNFMKDKKN
ncbi:mitochondrial ribosomal protein L37-domain-containing protein, partial [Spinellus fusiger]